MTERRPTRRRLLRALAVGVGAGLAGCPGDAEPSRSDDPATDSPPRGASPTATATPTPTPTATATPTPTPTSTPAPRLRTGPATCRARPVEPGWKSWPMARYDGAGSAVAPGIAGPNGAVLGTVWSIPTAVVAPVVVGPNGRRYYARTAGALLAVDSATGRVSWRFVAPAATGVGAAVDGSLAVTATADGALVGLAAATGERRWTAGLDGTPTAPPVLTADAVAVGTTEGLALRARADGRRCLALDTPGPVTAVVVAAGRLHAAVDRAPDGGLVAVDPRRGAVVAERFLAGRPRGLAATGDRLLVATADRLLALDPATGATRWTRDRTGPVAAGDAVYVADVAADRLVALDPATGETRWSTPAAGIGDVVATEEVVVATGGPAAAIGLHDPRTGWRRLRQRAATGYRRPSVADDRLFVVADDRTLALAAEPG